MSFNTEEFISAVQARTQIWQSKHSHHMNRNILNKLWKEIAELFPDKEVSKWNIVGILNLLFLYRNIMIDY